MNHTPYYLMKAPRNTMEQQRLSSLAMAAIENETEDETLKTINFNDVISSYAAENCRLLTLLYCF